jgi:hypothetical protein
MKYAINTEAITLFIKGSNIRIEKTNKKYPKIVKVFSLPKEEQEQAVLAIINDAAPNIEKVISEKEGFEVRGTDIFYKNEKLPKAFADKILSIIRDGLPLDHFEKFWENLEKNPSAQSVLELTEFLDYKELPITEDGHFLAYKGVSSDYFSVHGNTETKVILGTVNSTGRIYNGIGEVIEVRRRDVDDDRDKHCSYGLHAGSLAYARGFAPKLIVVKINPADVVSVPSDCGCQKVRVSKYEVIADFVEEIQSSVVDEEGQETIVPNLTKERTEFINKVDTYLQNKSKQSITEVTVRQIQNSFSPEWATKQQVLDALQELGVYFWVEDGVTYVDTYHNL